MKLLKYLLIIYCVLSFNISNAQDESLQKKITQNLRCLICQGQSVYDSDSEFALSLKQVVQNKLDEGLTEKEIYSFLKTKYGDWILYNPELGKNTYILWILPILLFLFGGAIIYKYLIFKKK